MGKEVSWIKSGIKGPMVRLHGYDHFGRNIYVPRCFIYKDRLDENVIKEALKKMMPSFSMLTGRITKDKEGYLAIDQNDQGIRFEVKHSNKTYKQYSAEDNFSKQAQKHVFYRLTIVNKNAPIVTVTITHFKDRGSVLGYSNIHSVMDGQSNIYFLTSLSNIIQGIEHPPFVFDREQLAFNEFDFHDRKEHEAVVMMSKRMLVKMYAKFISGFLYRNKSKMLKIEGHTLNKLKEYGLSQGEPTVSKMDLVAAILWKSVARVRKGKRIPLFNYTTNLRFKSSLNQYYIGNASTGYQLYAKEELLQKPIIDVARDIRSGLTGLDNAYAAREAQYLNKLVKERKIGKAVQKELVEIVHGGAVMFNSTYKYPFYSLDFGTGTPTWYDMPPGPMNGIFYTIPDADGQSINLGFGIDKNEMQPFLELIFKELEPFK